MTTKFVSLKRSLYFFQVFISRKASIPIMKNNSDQVHIIACGSPLECLSNRKALTATFQIKDLKERGILLPPSGSWQTCHQKG